MLQDCNKASASRILFKFVSNLFKNLLSKVQNCHANQAIVCDFANIFSQKLFETFSELQNLKFKIEEEDLLVPDTVASSRI